MNSGSAKSAPLPKRGGLVQNLFHLGMGQVGTTVLTMLLSAAIARTLGAPEYGLLYLLTSIASFAYVFVDWGHGPYVTREVAIHPHRSGEMMGNVVIVRAGTAVIMCGLAVIATSLLNYDVRTRVLAGLLILAWVPQYLALSFTWVFRGRERMEFDALLQVALKFVTLVIALACLALGGRLIGLIIATALSGVITFVLAVILYRHLGFPRFEVSRNTVLELVRDGAPMLAMSLAVAVQPAIDASLLYKLIPQEAVGWYGAAWTITGTLVAPATIVGAGLYPRLSRAATGRIEFARVLQTAFRPLFLLAVLGSVGTYLFADFAIGLIYTREKFGPAADVLKAFTPFLMLIYVDMLFGYAILAVRKAGKLAVAKIIAVIVTTIAELVLVPWFQLHYANGGVGIVLSLACGELVMVGAAVYLIRDFLGKGMLVDVIRGLAAGVVTIAVMRWLPPVTPFIGIPICVLMFAAVAVVLGSVKRADVELLSSSFGKRRGEDPEKAAGAEPIAP